MKYQSKKRIRWAIKWVQFHGSIIEQNFKCFFSFAVLRDQHEITEIILIWMKGRVKLSDYMY